MKKLKKRHNSVTCHKSREAFAACFSVTGNIEATENLLNTLTKTVTPSEFYKHTGLIILEKFQRINSALLKGKNITK